MGKVLACLFSLITITLYGDVSWESQDNPEFSFSVAMPEKPISVIRRVQIRATARSPKGYRVDREKLRSSLMNFIGYGPAPFSLLSEEAQRKGEDGEVITYTLNPNTPGDHLLTFGEVSFVTENEKKGVPESIETGVFSVAITLSKETREYLGQDSPLMTLSSTLPIGLSPENQERLYSNPTILEKQLLRNQELYQEDEASGFTYALILFSKVAFVVLALTGMIGGRPSVIPRRVVVRNAKERALDRLKELKRRNLPQRGEYVPYYNSLADTLRVFIEEVYHLKAPTMTTQEFIEHVSQDPILDEEEQRLLNSFLRHADIVKFAKKVPSDEQCSRAYELTRDVILNMLSDKKLQALFNTFVKG